MKSDIYLLFFSFNKIDANSTKKKKKKKKKKKI